MAEAPRRVHHEGVDHGFGADGHVSFLKRQRCCRAIHSLDVSLKWMAWFCEDGYQTGGFHETKARIPGTKVGRF